MGRCWLGIGLLVGLLTLGLVSSVAANRTYTRLADTLELAAEQLLTGEQEAGTALARKAQQGWESSRQAIAAVADHEPLEDIDSQFAGLQVYTRVGNFEELAVGCKQLAQLVRSVGDAQGLNWWDLL